MAKLNVRKTETIVGVASPEPVVKMLPVSAEDLTLCEDGTNKAGESKTKVYLTENKQRRGCYVAAFDVTLQTPAGNLTIPSVLEALVDGTDGDVDDVEEIDLSPRIKGRDGQRVALDENLHKLWIAAMTFTSEEKTAIREHAAPFLAGFTPETKAKKTTARAARVTL